MTITYSEDLIKYMEKKKKPHLIVEVVQSNNSDFEVTELYLHLGNEKDAVFFKEKKRYKAIATHCGEVLFPPYKLEYEEEIHFYLKSFGPIKMIKQTGINL